MMLQKALDLESEHIVKTHLHLVEHTNAHKMTNKRIAFEKTLWVLIVSLRSSRAARQIFERMSGSELA